MSRAASSNKTKCAHALLVRSLILLATRPQLELVIRSHECMQHGFDKMHDDTLITVFSASNYCGTVGNDGAFVIFEKAS